MDINQGRRVNSAEEIRSPLQGVDLTLRSAQSLALSMDAISTSARKRSQSSDVLVGAVNNRNGGVKLLNFGQGLPNIFINSPLIVIFFTDQRTFQWTPPS